MDVYTLHGWKCLLPWPSFLLPVSQSQESLELSVTSGEGCGFSRMLETPSKVLGWMEGNFFSLFLQYPIYKTEGAAVLL